jgi:hypothetical protein
VARWQKSPIDQIGRFFITHCLVVCNVSWFFFLRGTMEVETQIHGTLMYVHVFFKTAKAFGLPS